MSAVFFMFLISSDMTAAFHHLTSGRATAWSSCVPGRYTAVEGQKQCANCEASGCVRLALRGDCVCRGAFAIWYTGRFMNVALCVTGWHNGSRAGEQRVHALPGPGAVKRRRRGKRESSPQTDHSDSDRINSLRSQSRYHPFRGTHRP